MGRRAKGWVPVVDKRSGIISVRWTQDGRREHVSTGTRDPEEGAREAARIYAEAISGRRRAWRGAAREEVELTGSRWVESLDDNLDPETQAKYEQYVSCWADFFGRLDKITGPAIEDFWRARLREVRRRTVIKQLYALNGFLRWCVSRELMSEVPRYSMPPKSATGTPAKGRPDVELVPLSEGEIERLLAKLPTWSEKAQQETGRKWRVRDRFIVAWETALRPATLDALTAPGDYRRGAARLRIRDEIDKARFGRELPLTKRARRVLDRCAPELGLVLGRVDSHTASKYLRAAAAAAELPESKASKVKPYDIRHARLTLLAESGNLVGVAYLAGHKAITTTNRYVHAHRQAAEEVLEFRTARPESKRPSSERAARGRR